MLQFNLKNRDYILIEVPSDAYDFTLKTSGLTMDRSGYYYLSWKPDRMFQYTFSQKEPIDIIGKLSEVLQNEELCNQLVDSKPNAIGFTPDQALFDYDIFKDYSQSDEMFELSCDQFNRATDSFKSFLQSIDVDMNKHYLLIQKL